MCFGVLVLLHAGFSAAHYEALVEARYGVEDGLLPMDIYFELAASLAMVLLGALSTVSLVPVYSAGDASINSFHKLLAPRQDFLVFKAAAAAVPAVTDRASSSN